METCIRREPNIKCIAPKKRDGENCGDCWRINRPIVPDNRSAGEKAADGFLAQSARERGAVLDRMNKVLKRTRIRKP